jgi:hypothetical protein
MLALLMAFGLAACTGSGATGPAAEAAGVAKSARTEVLEAGASALKRDAPPEALDVYLVGFHPLKSSPKRQFEAHHFCPQVNQDFMQCALFDGDTGQAAEG